MYLKVTKLLLNNRNHFCRKSVPHHFSINQLLNALRCSTQVLLSNRSGLLLSIRFSLKSYKKHKCQIPLSCTVQMVCSLLCWCVKLGECLLKGFLLPAHWRSSLKHVSDNRDSGGGRTRVSHKTCGRSWGRWCGVFLKTVRVALALSNWWTWSSLAVGVDPDCRGGAMYSKK